MKLTISHYYLKPISKFLKFLKNVIFLVCFTQNPSRVYALHLTVLSLKIFKFCSNPPFATFYTIYLLRNWNLCPINVPYS